jgi:hypothetical protein
VHSPKCWKAGQSENKAPIKQLNKKRRAVRAAVLPREAKLIPISQTAKVEIAKPLSISPAFQCSKIAYATHTPQARAAITPA